jgi:hypothetical protein
MSAVKYLILMLLSAMSHTGVYKVERGVVLYTYVRDTYGSYAPYRKTLYTGNNSYDFFESTDELNINYAATCSSKDQDALNRLIKDNYTKRGVQNNAALAKCYRKKITDVGSVDYTLHSDYIYNKLNEDTLYLAFACSGTVLKMDAPECENFMMLQHSCLVPARPLSYPITFLYELNELRDVPQVFLEQLRLRKAQVHEIKVSYCE